MFHEDEEQKLLDEIETIKLTHKIKEDYLKSLIYEKETKLKVLDELFYDQI